MTISIPDMSAAIALFGPQDSNIKLISEQLSVSVHLRDNQLELSGSNENCKIAKNVLLKLLEAHELSQDIDPALVTYYIDLGCDKQLVDYTIPGADVVAITYKGKRISHKTLGQRLYVEAIKQDRLTFGIGPAGTGKTYLAVAMAAMFLKNKQVERLILTRPAVEAGEKLGFLPGDMVQKVDPYLRPLYDALFEMIGTEGYQRLLEKGMVEVAPLAFMRGRTLSNAFIILDEAQNTTPEQMKMFLTRIGKNSHCVVTGDLTQIDLPAGRKSGLSDAMDVLQDIEGIRMVHLTQRDVVRDELVQRIVVAYENASR